MTRGDDEDGISRWRDLITERTGGDLDNELAAFFVFRPICPPSLAGVHPPTPPKRGRRPASRPTPRGDVLFFNTEKDARRLIGWKVTQLRAGAPNLTTPHQTPRGDGGGGVNRTRSPPVKKNKEVNK